MRRDVAGYERSALPEPVSVQAALGDPSTDIHVRAGAELTVGPFAEHADTFRLARVESFNDVQRLGFVPEHISEASAIDAVRADDRLYRDTTRDLDAARCSCASEPGETASRPARALRRHYQNNLVDLLQPLQRRTLAAADTDVIHIHRQIERWISRPAVYLIGLVSISDIDVEEKATLFMTPTVTALYARNVTMGANSRLRFSSGNVHVRCKTVNGPNPLVSDRINVDRYVAGLSRELTEKTT